MIKEKVLLVIPPESSIKDDKQTESKWPRIGIAYLAAYLRKNEIRVKILDCKSLDLNHQDVAVKIREYNPDIIGLGPFTEEINEARKVCQTAKSINPNVITIFGGPHASALPQRTLEEFSELDLVVCGEGERTLTEIANGKDLSMIRGIAYRVYSQIIVNQPAELIKDLDSLPFPAWDLFPLDSYRGRLSMHLREKIKKPILELPILSARGCPFNCIFCYKAYPGLRNRNPINIIDEIEYNMKEYKATEFFFVEGTFAANREQGIKICDEIINRGLNKKIKWMVETRVNVVTEELLEKMKQAGCKQVDFGVESGDEQILANTKKGITINQVKKAVKLAKQAGLKVGCYFVIGHPFETEKTIKKTYRLARELDPDLMNVGIMIPYPGTEVRRMAEAEEGNYHLVCEDWSEYTKQRGGPLELTNIPLKNLQKIQSREYLRYYIRPSKIPFILKHVPPKKMIKIIKSLLKVVFS